MVNTMHYKQAEAEGETLCHTLGYVEVEDLIDTLTDMLPEAKT